jgi:hypothetical protein
LKKHAPNVRRPPAAAQAGNHSDEVLNFGAGQEPVGHRPGGDLGAGGEPELVQHPLTVVLATWFRRFIGVAELLGAIALIGPTAARFLPWGGPVNPMFYVAPPSTVISALSVR